MTELSTQQRMQPDPLPTRAQLGPGQSSGWRLEVIDGPNAGAVVPLAGGPIRVGTGADDDVVLAGLAPAHALFAVGVDGRLSVQATAPLAVGGRRLGPGARRVLRGNASLVLNGVTVRLLAAAAPRRSNPLLFGAAATGLVALAVVATVLALRPTGAEALSRPAPVAAPPAPRPSLESVQMALQQRLRDSGLDRRLSVTAAGSALAVQGGLSPAEAALWQDVRTWYDGRFGGGPALLVRLTPAAPAATALPDLRVRAIALGPVPYLIAADGARYTEGAVLAGGWVITRIAPDRVELARGAESGVLTF